MAEHNPEVRAEVEAAVLAEIERVGADKLNKAALLKPWMERGFSRATLYRYADAVIKTGKAGQHMARKVVEAVAARQQEPDPPAAAGKAAGSKLPVIVRMADVAGTGPISVLNKLAECVAIADQLILHARTPDGAVRSARLLLQASEHLRRTLDTVVRIQERQSQEDEMARFHRSIIEAVEEVARAHPEIAEIVTRRLGQVAQEWGG